MPTKKKSTDAIDILHNRYYKKNQARIANLEIARANDDVARKDSALRKSAGVSQRELAALVGTTASVICRLENAEYEGHSLALLRRVAAALKKRVEIRFVSLG